MTCILFYILKFSQITYSAAKGGKNPALKQLSHCYLFVFQNYRVSPGNSAFPVPRYG